jgi:Tol biopolymer transport system component
VYTPFWKPDSQEFAFWEGGKLKRASVIGGPPTNIADVPAPFGGGSWSSSGVIVYSSAGSLYRVLDVGGETTPAAKLDTSLGETEHVAPYFLPDGRRFLYLAVSSQTSNSAVYVGSLDSAERTRLFDSESKAVYAEPG